MIRVFLRSFVEAWNDNVPRLGASLAFYTLFTLAPTVLVATAIASHISADPGVRERLVSQINGLVGTQGGGAVRVLVESARAPVGGGAAALTGLVAFVLAATGAFLELQAALNGIWRVTPIPGLNLAAFLKDRVRSFAVMVGVGLLLLASLAGSAWLAGGRLAVAAHPAGAVVLAVANLVMSILLASDALRDALQVSSRRQARMERRRHRRGGDRADVCARRIRDWHAWAGRDDLVA
jgi:membrane protein